ncbi:hypothetical protein EJB05_13522 [Eragrostis curvula]|uniref:Uncharacterized protein n=1 Tax=Eragrostis curvula TaxID=38414 RepID=A0A5J9VXL3_9POAL|nr:hypothetical protein EJB05_13522 [Eragrostis curvula]
MRHVCSLSVFLIEPGSNREGLATAAGGMSGFSAADGAQVEEHGGKLTSARDIGQQRLLNVLSGSMRIIGNADYKLKKSSSVMAPRLVPVAPWEEHGEQHKHGGNLNKLIEYRVGVV